PLSKMSRSVAGAFFQTRVFTPRISIACHSNGEPGPFSRASASASDMTGQGFADGSDISGLVLLEPRQPVGVEIGVAEEFFGNAYALHEQSYVDRVGHADAAMHLNGFLDGERRRLAGAGFRYRHEGFRLIRLLIQLLQRLQ